MNSWYETSERRPKFASLEKGIAELKIIEKYYDLQNVMLQDAEHEGPEARMIARQNTFFDFAADLEKIAAHLKYIGEQIK